MEKLSLKSIREHLGLTQAEFATMLGYSVRAIQSCEQGWRRPSPALEKMALLLYMAYEQGAAFGERNCWEVLQCSPLVRETCVAYQTRQGHLCWFLTGNMACALTPVENWDAKKAICVECTFFQRLLAPPGSEPPPCPEGQDSLPTTPEGSASDD